MPSIHLPNGTRLHYEVVGQGPALLALAPGGLKSRSELWARREDGRARGIVDPVAAFADRFTVITLDQRNAGRSFAPIAPSDGWAEYAEDHLLLLDALAIKTFHILGACIGPSFALKLIERAPERVLSAVLQQPIGKSADNQALRRESFNSWADGLAQRGQVIDRATLQSLEHNLFGGDFVYSVSREFVAACQTPLLVLPGNDLRHPQTIGEEIARLAPDARLFADWQTQAGQQRYAEVLEQFFTGNPQLSGVVQWA